MRIRFVQCAIDVALGDGVQRQAVDFCFRGGSAGNVLFIQLVQHFVVVPVEVSVHEGESQAGPHVWVQLPQVCVDPSVDGGVDAASIPRPARGRRLSGPLHQSEGQRGGEVGEQRHRKKEKKVGDALVQGLVVGDCHCHLLCCF
jgi:hypothetical protein